MLLYSNDSSGLAIIFLMNMLKKYKASLFWENRDIVLQSLEGIRRQEISREGVSLRFFSMLFLNHFGFLKKPAIIAADFSNFAKDLSEVFFISMNKIKGYLLCKIWPYFQILRIIENEVEVKLVITSKVSPLKSKFSLVYLEVI